MAGRNGIATIKASLVGLRDGGFASEHDFHIASLIADVVCGGDVNAGSLVTEEYLMTLERKHFCSLLDHPKIARANHGHAANRQAGEELTHPRCGLAAASPSRGRHQRPGKAGSAVATRQSNRSD